MHALITRILHGLASVAIPSSFKEKETRKSLFTTDRLKCFTIQKQLFSLGIYNVFILR